MVSKFIAVLLLPVYTRYINPAGYGVVELLGNGVILISILVRFGMIESFLRFYYTDDDQARRDSLARRAIGFLLLTTTIASIVLAVFAAPLSKIVLGYRDPAIFRIAVLGLWAFTNLEMAYALLRVDERLRAYATAYADQCRAHDRRLAWCSWSGSGRAPRVCCSATTAPPRSCCWGCGGRCASGLRRAPARRRGDAWRCCCASACRPSPPRRRCTRSASSTATTSITTGDRPKAGRPVLDRGQARRCGRVHRAGVPVRLAAARLLGPRRCRGVATVWTCDHLLRARQRLVVAGLALLGRWVLRLLAAPSYFDAYKALPWVALGWAMYGLWVVFLVIAGRAKVTTRNFPAAAGRAGCERSPDRAACAAAGDRRRRHRPVRRVRGDDRVHAPADPPGVRGRRSNGCGWPSSRSSSGGCRWPATCCCRRMGWWGCVSRAAVLAAMPLVLLVTGFAHRAEIEQARVLLARARRGMPVSRPKVSVVMPFAGDAYAARAAIDALLALDLRVGDELILADNSGLAVARGGVAGDPRGRRALAGTRPQRRSRERRTASGSCSSTPTAEPRGAARRLLRGAGRRRRRRARGRGRAAARRRDTLAARYGAARSFLSQEAHLTHPYRPRAVAANLLVRRDAFEQVGGFYEGVRAAEDTDFSWRLQRAGWRLELRPRCAGRAPLPGDARRAATAVAGVRGGPRVAGAALRRVRARAGRARAVGRALQRTRHSGADGAAGAGGRPRAAPAVSAGRLERGRYLALDALLSADELAGLVLSNRPAGRVSRTAAAVVFVADRFPARGDPLVDFARALDGARVEAAARPEFAESRDRGRPSRSTTARTTGSPRERRRSSRWSYVTRCVRSATCSAAGPGSRRCRRSRRRCAGWHGTGARACTRSGRATPGRPPAGSRGWPAGRSTRPHAAADARPPRRPLGVHAAVRPRAGECARRRRRERRAVHEPVCLRRGSAARRLCGPRAVLPACARGRRVARASRREAGRARARHAALPRHRRVCRRGPFPVASRCRRSTAICCRAARWC